MVQTRTKPLLVVDGYNLLYSSSRYTERIDEPGRAPLFSDPFVRSRESLLTDVATWAGSRYEAHIIYDAADNLAPQHPSFTRAGLKVHYSAYGQSADELIETLVSQARREGRDVVLVTSDSVIRASIGSGAGKLQCISSKNFVAELEKHEQLRKEQHNQRPKTKLTLLDRLPQDQQEKMRALLGLESRD